jgi:hypothetical protein
MTLCEILALTLDPLHVKTIISRMIFDQELAASWDCDGTVNTAVLYFHHHQTRTATATAAAVSLPDKAIQLSAKLGQLLDSQERLLDTLSYAYSGKKLLVHGHMDHSKPSHVVSMMRFKLPWKIPHRPKIRWTPRKPKPLPPQGPMMTMAAVISGRDSFIPSPFPWIPLELDDPTPDDKPDDKSHQSVEVESEMIQRLDLLAMTVRSHCPIGVEVAVLIKLIPKMFEVVSRERDSVGWSSSSWQTCHRVILRVISLLESYPTLSVPMDCADWIVRSDSIKWICRNSMEPGESIASVCANLFSLISQLENLLNAKYPAQFRPRINQVTSTHSCHTSPSSY